MSSGRHSRNRFMERIKNMPLEELELLRDELKTDLTDLNRQRNWTGTEFGRPASIRNTRRNIARVETRISELRRKNI